MFTQIATVVAIAAGAAATPVVRQNSGQATYYQVSVKFVYLITRLT